MKMIKKTALTLLIISSVAWLVYALSGIFNNGRTFSIVNWIANFFGETVSPIVSGIVFSLVVISSMIGIFLLFGDIKKNNNIGMISLILMIVGGFVWGLYALGIGALETFLPMWLSYIVYILVGVAGIISIKMYGEIKE